MGSQAEGKLVSAPASAEHGPVEDTSNKTKLHGGSPRSVTSVCHDTAQPIQGVVLWQTRGRGLLTSP